MNTVNIDDVLKNDPYAKRSFRGVFSLDEFVAYLTRSNVNKGIFVFNTQTSTKSGEHWICVIVEDNVIYYFDSFGRNPASYSYVAETLLLSNKIIEWNKYFFQNPATNVCGDYCTLFALLVSRGWHLQQYVNWLYSLGNSEERDHTIRRIMLYMYGHSSFDSYKSYPHTLSGIDNIHLKQIDDYLDLTCVFLK